MTQDIETTSSLHIEWRHCEDGWQRCDRCSATWSAITDLVGELARDVGHRGTKVTYRETFITPDRLDEANMVLFNGVPIEDLLPNATVSKSPEQVRCAPDGDQILARTIEVDGEAYEAVPKKLLREAAMLAIETNDAEGCSSDVC